MVIWGEFIYFWEKLNNHSVECWTSFVTYFFRVQYWWTDQPFLTRGIGMINIGTCGWTSTTWATRWSIVLSTLLIAHFSWEILVRSLIFSYVDVSCRNYLLWKKGLEMWAQVCPRRPSPGVCRKQYTVHPIKLLMMIRRKGSVWYAW